MSSLATAEKLFTDAVERHLAGDLSGAEGRYRRVLGRFPSNVPSLLNLGVVLLAKGAVEQALTSFRRAVKAMPENADAHNNLGTALEQLGRVEEAEAAYRRALELDRNQPDAHNNLANILRARGAYDDAVGHYRLALAAAPTHIKALDNLGDALRVDGRLDEARVHCDRAEVLRPSFGRRIRRGLILPPVYQSRAALAAAREGFFTALDELEAAPESIVDPLAELNHLPFYLAYQGYDDRATLERFAALLRPSLPEQVEPQTKMRRGRSKRIGVVSAFWSGHSVGSCFDGFWPILHAAGLELVMFNAGANSSLPMSVRGTGEVKALPRDLRVARQIIADQQLDALLYLELGMDPFSYFLAATRLAPVQLVVPGHPMTSGLKTVDYFVSCEQVEANDAERFFTERLVRLSWCPALWKKPEILPDTRDRVALGLPEAGSLYLCPMTLYKLHPAFDHCLSGILEGDPGGHIILFEDRHSSRLGDATRQRLAETLGAHAGRIRFLPFLGPTDFKAVLRHATVVLDTHPFGGATTLLAALALGVPYVTHPTSEIRGRSGAALYQAAGINGPIAESDEDYVRKVLTLAHTPTDRAQLSAEIAARAGQLFDNPAGAQDFAGLLDRLCGGQGDGRS